MTGLLLPLAGLLAAALLWAAGAGWMETTTPVASAFAPTATAEALQALLQLIDSATRSAGGNG